MNATCRDFAASLGLLVLRLGMGGYMAAAHGWGKAQMVMAGKYDQFADPLELGNKMSLIGAAMAEFVCSVLVVLGLFTRVAAVPLVFTMGVAAFIVHRNDPWAGPPPSKEPALMYLAAFLTLILTGPGRFSLDAAIWGRRKRAKVEA